MIRYYLIPAVRNIIDLPRSDDGVKPDFLDIISNLPGCLSCQGIPPAEIPTLRGNDRQWLANHYIVRIEADDFTELDTQNVIYLDRQTIINNIDKLQSLGVEINGLDINTPKKQIERRIIKWLTNQNKDLGEVMSKPEEIG